MSEDRLEVVDKIRRKMYEIRDHGFWPEYVVLGKNEYEVLLGRYKEELTEQGILPNNFEGIEIVVVPGSCVEVVTSIENEVMYGDDVRG